MPVIGRRSFLKAGTISSLGVAVPASAAATNAFHVAALRVGMREVPLGIDNSHPSLSWRLGGPDGAMQAAYQILVATRTDLLRPGAADLWDSGRVESAECTGIPYQGQGLASRAICYWKVRVWSNQGVSAWSEPSSWEMGLLQPEEWTGDWLAVEDAIERDDRIAGAQWVSGPAPSPTQPRSFRLRFESGAGAGVLTIIGDGALANLKLDGRALPLPAHDPNAFGGAPAAAIPLSLAAGEHLLSVDVSPSPGFFAKPFVALAAQLRFTGPDGSVKRLTGGWETRMGSGADTPWTTAELQQKQRLFPWPPTPARLMRRAFRVDGKISRARLYIAALGGYRLWINGQPVSEDQLQPEPSNFAKRIPYRTFDVTSFLKNGDNVLGALVGDGFFASYQAPDGRYAYGPAPRRIRAFIEYACTDGRIERVATDDLWRHARSPILMSEIYAGEDHDLRLWPGNWTEPTFDDGDWEAVWNAPPPTAALSAPLADPIRITRSMRPKSVRRVGERRFIVDFGQNFAGRVRLSVRGTEGQSITVRHAEILDSSGMLDRRNLRAARAEDRYILRGNQEGETLEPALTYQGFRYVEIDGLADLPGTAIEGLVLSSDLGETGLFRVEQPDVQKLWMNALWSQRSNFMGVPTDCPQRDERLGWTGDAQLFWDAASFNMDVGAFTRSYARILRDDQSSRGAYPLWAPSPGGLGWGTDSSTPGWADAGVMLPYIAYLHSGDRSIVDENWEAMVGYVDGILSTNPTGLWQNGRGADLGDWLALDAKTPMDETTPKALIASAMLARSIDQLVRMARWTGRTDDAERWSAQYRRTSAAFAEAFVKPDGTVGNGSHGSYILGLALGLVPKNLRTAAGAKLAGDIRRRGTLLSTGFLCTSLALDALASVGQQQLIGDLLLRTEFPSWGYMVRRGATTIWERWNGDIGDVTMNSFNHYALGAVCGFLYRRIAAIDPVSPGFARFRVSPIVDPRLKSAGATLDSVRGRIATRWTVQDRRVAIDVTVPANSVASIAYGDVHRDVGPGHHRLVTSLQSFDA